MADIEREMADFKAANRTFGGEWKLEMKGKNNNSSSSSDRSSVPVPVPVPVPPQPVHLSNPSTFKVDIDKYSRSYYNYNKSNVNWGVAGDPELKRQRRMVKYKSYAVESKLMSGFRWMKNKYCEFVHGY